MLGRIPLSSTTGCILGLVPLPGVQGTSIAWVGGSSTRKPKRAALVSHGEPGRQPATTFAFCGRYVLFECSCCDVGEFAFESGGDGFVGGAGEEGVADAVGGDGEGGDG